MPTTIIVEPTIVNVNIPKPPDMGRLRACQFPRYHSPDSNLKPGVGNPPIIVVISILSLSPTTSLHCPWAPGSHLGVLPQPIDKYTRYLGY